MNDTNKINVFFFYIYVRHHVIIGCKWMGHIKPTAFLPQTKGLVIQCVLGQDVVNFQLFFNKDSNCGLIKAVILSDTVFARLRAPCNIL